MPPSIVRRLKIPAIAVALAFGATPVSAGSAPSALPVVAHPLVHARDGAIHGCGVRLTGGEPGGAASGWFDVSFNVFRRGVALAQSIAYEIRRSTFDGDARPARVPVQTTWLKASRSSARLGENAERRETLVYALAMDDAIALFEALASGETLTVGLKRWDQRSASVYAGAPELAAEDRRTLQSCLDRLVE